MGLAGEIVYHGPREYVLDFFGEIGFQLPHRKGIADFLQADPLSPSKLIMHEQSNGRKRFNLHCNYFDSKVGCVNPFTPQKRQVVYGLDGNGHYVALQEVTSKKDQRQFWKGKRSAYRYVSIRELAASFREFHVGRKSAEVLSQPPAKTDKGMPSNENHLVIPSVSKQTCFPLFIDLLLQAGAGVTGTSGRQLGKGSFDWFCKLAPCLHHHTHENSCHIQ